MPRRLVFLYTELAPYFLACAERLAKDHDVEVHIVRWPVNAEAPFELHAGAGLKLYQRERYGTADLQRLVADIAPHAVFASGWVDPGYMQVCRAQRARGTTVVLCSDTAWRGDLRQWAAAITGRWWARRAFSHAWVTGRAQAVYARKLGLRASRIATGFYSADTERFPPAEEKRTHFPHRFLCVARYIPTKGHQLLCDAFARLCDHGGAGDWDLWIVGTGELHEEVMRSTSGAHPRIKHLGFVQADAMGGVMAQCGVFVLPSLYEPWGVAVHEHACAGFPLLLSDAVGAGERFLIEEQNGRRFRSGIVEDIEGALRTIVARNDDELRAMGARSTMLGRAWSPKEWATTAVDLIARP